MAISFNQVPSTVRVPFAYIEFDSSRAVQGLNALEYSVLLLGQKLDTGTADAGELVLLSSAEQAGELFGTGSMLHAMAEAYFANNDFTTTYAVALEDDGAAAAASGSVTFAGTATAAGTMALYIGGRQVRVGVSSGDAAAAVATAAAAAINADSTLPVTAAVDGGTPEKVTITARNKGEAGNGIDIRVNYYTGEALPAGITATIAAMSGGTANPDISAALAAVGDEWFQVIACPYTDAQNLGTLEDELADRWGPLRQIEGVAFAARTGTLGELATFGNGLNSQFLSVMACTGSPSPAYEWAAAVAGVAAYYGAIDQARPFQTLPIQWVKAPRESARFTLSERNTLLYDGIATHNVDSGGQVRIERLVTTYQKNAYGAPDTAYLDVNTVLTLGYLRYDMRTFWLNKYPRHKLANDGTRYGAGQAIMTPKVAKAEVVNRFRMWEEQGLVEGFDQFKNDLIVERNGSDPNRLDILMSPDLVNQLRVTGVQIAFLL